jgi:hypothetical protein
MGVDHIVCTLICLDRPVLRSAAFSFFVLIAFKPDQCTDEFFDVIPLRKERKPVQVGINLFGFKAIKTSSPFW